MKMGKRYLKAGAAIFALAFGTQGAWAQEAPETPSDETNVVVVTGFRASVQNALRMKRNSNAAIDVINAQDIADFPDANLAESLQRIPGVAIDRDNGEGRTITVRGLGADFTRVRLNGLEALSTAGANDATSSGNRSRGFDFNTFASELFSQLAVRKTPSGDVDEGSLGATVDLTSGHPLDFKKDRYALSIQDGWYENGDSHNPRIAALASKRFSTRIGEIGVLVSAAYNTRNQRADGYNASPGSADYVYRAATFTPLTTLVNGQNRQGFAAPAGTPCDQIVPNTNITNMAMCDALRGSDPATYALINSPQGSTVVNGVVTAPGSTIRFPALPAVNSLEIEQKRIGLTGSVQWRPDDTLTVSVDGLASELENRSTNYQLVTFGLVRGDLANGLYQQSAANDVNTKRNFYTRCVSRAATDILAPIDCGNTVYGTTPVAGTQFSFNPYNWDPYEYYNLPSSPGYVADPNGIANRIKFIGKPTIKILDGHLTPQGAADYLKFGNVDISSVADQSTYTTRFEQLSLNIDKRINDTLKMSLIFGHSMSSNRSTGLIAEFEHPDAGQGTSPTDYVIYDNRENGPMPSLNVGFDAANPANWDMYKGHSSLRHYKVATKNTFSTARADFTWNFQPDTALKFGYTHRSYTFSTIFSQRVTADSLNPSFKEAGTTLAAVSRLTNWGVGLDAPANTTTSFISPDLEKLEALYDFTCNCINKWGDFRMSNLPTASNTFGVKESDSSLYVMTDFRRNLFGGTIRGDIGIRYAKTTVVADGLTNTSRPVSNDNSYSDTLPSLNLVYEPIEDLLFRFSAAKVMARPGLNILAPSVTSFSSPGTAGATTGGSITLGNTKLKPFRGANYDFSVEWYFRPNSVLALALFDKELNSYPQTVVSAAKLSEILTPEIISQLRASQSNVNSLAYIDADNIFSVRQYRDAPGGFIEGAELNYQQDFKFLPGFWSNFGLLANYTYIHSKLSYILDPGSPAVGATPAKPQILAGGPFTGASPESYNITLYYETPTWSIRGSIAHRGEYYTQFPVSSGTCEPGFCDGPLIRDFVGSRATTNFDMAMQIKLSKSLSLSVDALNLTDQTTNRFAYINSPLQTSYNAPGRQVFFGLRYTY